MPAMARFIVHENKFFEQFSTSIVLSVLIIANLRHDMTLFVRHSLFMYKIQAIRSKQTRCMHSYTCIWIRYPLLIFTYCPFASHTGVLIWSQYFHNTSLSLSISMERITIIIKSNLSVMYTLYTLILFKEHHSQKVSQIGK